MSKKCLINVEGGLGKNVALTAILPTLKQKYDEIYVISPYFDVFKACSVVADAFPPGQGTLYQELVLDEDCDVFWKEPYSNQRFIKKQCHLLEAWAEEFGITLEYDGMSYEPFVDKIATEFPNLAEGARKQIDEWKHNYCIVQFNGGQSPLAPMQDQKGNMTPYNDRMEALKRNYFKGERVVQLLKQKYGDDCTIVQYALPNEPSVPGTVKIQVPYLMYRLLAVDAKEIICIDSSLQHLATGVNPNVTVIWGETRPEHFGYANNRNVCAKHVLNSQPYFKPLGISPSMVKMPEPEELVIRPTTTNPEEVTENE